jgi:hypothetical protein
MLSKSPAWGDGSSLTVKVAPVFVASPSYYQGIRVDVKEVQFPGTYLAVLRRYENETPPRVYLSVHPA